LIEAAGSGNEMVKPSLRGEGNEMVKPSLRGEGNEMVKPTEEVKEMKW